MYSPFHIHTEYSLLDGAIKIKDLFKRAKELGIKSLAITEHGSFAGTIKKYQLAKAAGIKLIMGIELYIADDMLVKEKGDNRVHLVVIARNLRGYKNLVKIASIAACDGFYYKPRIDKKTLAKYSEGLIATTACLKNDIAQAILRDDPDEARVLIKEYIDMFGKDNFFLEVANHGIAEEKKIAAAYFKLAEELDIRVIFGNDAHYLQREHAHVHDVVLCFQTQDFLSNPKRYKFDGGDFHVLSEIEARKLFPGNQEVFDNTQVLAQMCDVDIPIGKSIFPHFTLPDGETSDSYLNKLCYEGFYEKYGDDPAIKRRLDYELSVVHKMGYAEYFLIIQDVIREVGKREGILTVGRGSSGGSVAAACLGIHQLDPIKLNLLFERFLNPDRVSLPDIDTDFADRDVAIKYVQEKYGEDRVALIGTFGTLGCKSAIKDASRVLEISFDEVNAITADLENGITLEEALKVSIVVDFFNKHSGLMDIVKVIEGMVKFSGVHAAGVCWGKGPITDYVPVKKVEDKVVTQYDMEEIEAIGLVKFDFLGLETMNIIKNTLKIIGKDDGWLRSIPLDDKETYDMLTAGDSQGIFQLSSGGMINALKKIKPTCFNDIVAIVSLFRPGCMEYVDVYAKRKHGEEQIVYDHPKLEPVLKDMYGILIYQESLMELTRVLAGFTNSEADILRKSIGKKKIELMLSLKQKFSDGCKKYSGMNDAQVNDLWDKILKFADYSFNRSHGCFYALSSYRTAYLKRHYPVEFMTAMINSEMKDIDKQVFYMQEVKKMGIKILPPDINISGSQFVTDQGRIRFGLEGIKNVSGVSLDIIMVNRPYKSFIDFINKVDVSKVNRRVQKHLIEAGAFDSFGTNRNRLLAGYLDISPKEKGKDKQLTLFGSEAGFTFDYPDRHEPTLSEKIKMEKDAMGIPASGDFIDLYPELADAGIPKDLNSGRVRVFGIAQSIKKVFTKKDNREMCFMMLGNRDGQLEVVVFPNQFSIYSGALYEDAGLVVEGNMQNGHLLADTIDLLHGVK